jgi:hypothetical protein
MSDVDLEKTPKGSKKVTVSVPIADVPSPGTVKYEPPALTGALQWPANPNGAVALAIELERMKEQLNDAAMQIAAKQLEIDNLKITVKECMDAVNLSGVERDVALNEVAEIRGVLKSLAAILIKWDGWQPKHDPQQVQKQDPQPEVQS